MVELAVCLTKSHGGQSILLANIPLFLSSGPVLLLALMWATEQWGPGGLLKAQEGSRISGAEVGIVGGDLRTAVLSSGAKTRPGLG